MNGDNDHFQDVPDSEAVPASGGLEDGVMMGYKYSVDPDGTTTTLTYSFPGPSSRYDSTSYPADGRPWPTDGLSQLSEYGMALFEEKLAFVERITNIEFVRVDDSGNSAGIIRPAWIKGTNVTFSGYGDGPFPEVAAAGDIWLTRDILTNENHPEFERILNHELGHALGLKHPHEVRGDFPVLSAEWLGREYTIMSYTNSLRHPEMTQADQHPQTFMYVDILALQRMYGVDTETTGGRDIYSYDQADRHYLTIWDAGGNDTIEVTNGTKPVQIDLTPGSWSNVGTSIHYHNGGPNHEYEKQTVFITPDTIIENATGADGNDSLTGNHEGNRLKGHGGQDTLEGHAGNDTIIGGDGDDYSHGGAGNDQIWAGPDDTGDDHLMGGAGNDLLGGGHGNDFIVGDDKNTDGTDNLFGGKGNDTLIGGAWQDSGASPNGRFDPGEAIQTGTQVDVIWAGEGNDLVYGNAGDDVIGTGTGNDTIDTGDGANTVYAGQGDDTITGGAHADKLFGGGQQDSLNGGAGNDILWGSAGDDTLTGGAGSDTFSFVGNSGDDVITDFNPAEDFLSLPAHINEGALEIVASSETSDGLILDLSNGGSILLVGLSMSDASQIIILE